MPLLSPGQGSIGAASAGFLYSRVFSSYRNNFIAAEKNNFIQTGTQCVPHE